MTATQKQTTAGSQTQPKQVAPIDSVRALFENNRKALEAACTKILSADRLIQLMYVECRRNLDLTLCSGGSLMGALFTMAQLGLSPGPMGLIYPIPFNNRKSGRKEIQLIIGYKGLIELARRSDELATIQAHVVREGDSFSYSYGIHPDIQHTPAMTFNPKAKVTHIYAIGSLKNGYHQFEVMSIEEIEKHRDQYSKAAKEGPWVTAPEEMQKKTVLRRVCKLLPASAELKTAVSLDELAEAQLSQHLGALPEVTIKDPIEEIEADELKEIQEGLKEQQAETPNGQATVSEAEVLEEPRPKPVPPKDPDPISDARWLACIKYMDSTGPIQQLKVQTKKRMMLEKLQPLIEPARTGFLNTMSDIAKAAGVILTWPE